MFDNVSRNPSNENNKRLKIKCFYNVMHVLGTDFESFCQNKQTNERTNEQTDRQQTNTNKQHTNTNKQTHTQTNKTNKKKLLIMFDIMMT